MEKEIKKSLFMAEFAFLAVVVGGSALIYWLFSPSYYRHQKSKLIKAAYADLKEMDFNTLDEDDGSVLDQYEKENLSFIIADEDFTPLYVSWSESPERQVYKHVVLCKENFSEEPEVINRETRNPMAVKLLGLVRQEGKVYYVNIRERIDSLNDPFSYVVKFLTLTLLIFIVIGIPLLYMIFGRIYVKMRQEMMSGRKIERGSESLRSIQTDAVQTGAIQVDAVQMDTVQMDDLHLGDKSLDDRRLDAVRRDVVADISHELKTPLAIISSQVEMLHCMGDQVDREYYYDSIVEEISRMSDMVNNLMDLSLMEHQIQKMERQTMDLTDTMEYIQVKYQALFKQSHIKDQFSLEEDCKICGNAYYLEQAIDNYMMNALSHTVQGGVIQVSLYREDGWVWVSVYNQGEKIEDSVMEKIWQGYVIKRSKGEDPLEQRHMGIGLYLVRRIIRLHGGEYGVENQEKGVRFWFKIPEADRSL